MVKLDNNAVFVTTTKQNLDPCWHDVQRGVSVLENGRSKACNCYFKLVIFLQGCMQEEEEEEQQSKT
jgi:hypothetical protein